MLRTTGDYFRLDDNFCFNFSFIRQK